MTRFLIFWAWFASAIKILVYLYIFGGNARMGTAVIQLVPVFFIVLTVFVLLFQSPLKRRSIGFPPVKVLLAYIGWITVSLAWTAASSKLSAAGYWVGLISDVALVALFLSYFQASTVAFQAMRGYVWANLLVAAVATFMRTEDLRMGDEEFLHPNAIGNQFAIAALFALILAIYGRQKWRWSIAATLLVAALLRTLSKASILSFLAAVGLYLLFRSKLLWGTRAKFAGCGLVLMAAATPYVMDYIDLYTAEGQHLTLSGRTVIWAVSYDIAQDRPLIGHGFYSYRSLVPNFGEFQAWHAHNEWLQQWFCYGLVGVALAVAVYASLFLQVRRSLRSPASDLAWMMLIYALLHGLTDANHIELSLPLRIILLCSVWLGHSQTNPFLLSPPRQPLVPTMLGADPKFAHLRARPVAGSRGIADRHRLPPDFKPGVERA